MNTIFALILGVFLTDPTLLVQLKGTERAKPPKIGRFEIAPGVEEALRGRQEPPKKGVRIPHFEDVSPQWYSLYQLKEEAFERWIAQERREAMKKLDEASRGSPQRKLDESAVFDPLPRPMPSPQLGRVILELIWNILAFIGIGAIIAWCLPKRWKRWD